MLVRAHSSAYDCNMLREGVIQVRCHQRSWRGPVPQAVLEGICILMFLGTVFRLWTACNSWWSHSQMGDTEIIIGPLQFSTLITYYSWEVFWELPKWKPTVVLLVSVKYIWPEQLASGYLHAYVTNKFKWLLALALRNHMVLWGHYRTDPPTGECPLTEDTTRYKGTLAQAIFCHHQLGHHFCWESLQKATSQKVVASGSWHLLPSFTPLLHIPIATNTVSLQLIIFTLWRFCLFFCISLGQQRWDNTI